MRRKVNRRPRGTPYSRRGRSSSVALSRRVVTGFAVFVVGFLVGIHLYLLRVVTSRDTTSLPLPPSIGSQVTNSGLESVTPLRDIDMELYTIRINTWQRLEQLLVSVEHHSTCPGVAQIQVVWCEDKDPPTELEQFPKVVVERHVVNSLNERFHILEETPTMGILSVDDDVLRPCVAIDSGFFKWTRNPHRMVGFDARTHVVDNNGKWLYGYMSTMEKTNQYSLSLPRYCFIHRDYLNSYMTALPRPIFDHVQQVFNCEDIAMSFWISHLTGGRPPLLADTWAMKSMVKLYSEERISGTHDHKKLRDGCVDSFAQQLGLKPVLKRANVVHRESPFFEAGAASDDAPPDNWQVVERNAALMKQVHHWKHMPAKEAIKEVQTLRGHMMRHAYVLGLIEKTPPWEERWKKA